MVVTIRESSLFINTDFVSGKIFLNFSVKKIFRQNKLKKTLWRVIDFRAHAQNLILDISYYTNQK